MADQPNTTAPAADKKEKAAATKYKYVGPKIRRGLYLPDGKLIHPDRIADADLEFYMEKFPELNQYFKTV